MTSPLSRADWESEHVDRCQALVQGLPSKSLVRVATAVLAACVNVIEAPPEVRAVLAIGGDPSRWGEGHRAFDRVRELVLRLPAHHGNDPHAPLLYVAENAARVIYNATIPYDPFDHDSGAWLLASLAQFARTANKSLLKDTLWETIETTISAERGRRD